MKKLFGSIVSKLPLGNNGKDESPLRFRNYRRATESSVHTFDHESGHYATADTSPVATLDLESGVQSYVELVRYCLHTPFTKYYQSYHQILLIVSLISSLYYHLLFCTTCLLNFLFSWLVATVGW